MQAGPTAHDYATLSEGTGDKGESPATERFWSASALYFFHSLARDRYAAGVTKGDE